MPSPQVDSGELIDEAIANRIGLAWRELRRGGASSKLRDHLFRSETISLEHSQVDTLELLVQHAQWRMSDLADALRVDPSTATRAVQRMLALGFAERHADPVDGRVVIVSATAAGRGWYAALRANRRAMMQSVLSTFSAAERVQFADLVERFVAAIDAFVADLDG